MKSLILILAPLLLANPCSSRAEDLVWATGHVVTPAGPARGAIVAVYDRKGKVIDYARTDSEGNYGLAVPRSALNLQGKGRGGFLHQVTSGVSRLVGGMAGPLKMGIRAAAGASGFSDPITRAGVGAASGVAQNMVDTLAPQRKTGRMFPPPGSLVMKAVLPGCKDAVGIAHVYWLQEELYRAGGREQRTLAAWFDPVKLAPQAAEKPSEIGSPYLLFANARIEPSIVEPGATVVIRVRLPSPPEPRTPLVVVARNSRNGRLVELSPAGMGEYRAELTVDRSFPKNDQVYTILAYAEQPERPGRVKRVEDAIAGAGLFDAKKPFVYNPLLVASRNRGEVTLTVVEPPR